jgi:hypothetical protein
VLAKKRRRPERRKFRSWALLSYRDRGGALGGVVNWIGSIDRSYLQVEAVDPGFSRELLTLKFELDEHYTTPEARAAVYKRFLEKLHALQGFQHVGVSSGIPLTDNESVTSADIKGFGP